MSMTKTQPQAAAVLDDPPLDTAAAARYLGIKPTTLETWRSTRKVEIPYEKIGRAVRYRRSALDAHRAQNTK